MSTVQVKRVTVLGATGSIGTSTLDVIARHADRYRVYALSAHFARDKLLALCQVYHPEVAVVSQQEDAQWLQAALSREGLSTRVDSGAHALCEIAKAPDADIVVAAIMGGAGLAPTLSAVDAGKHVLLANKESLVMAGQLFIDAAHRSGARILPVDSEHNAIFQCLPTPHGATALHDTLSAQGVSRVLLTASGGPFKDWRDEQLATVTPAQACAHPNWSMGRKISVDSATLMNKGLELIEACWLFNLTPADIQVVVHPQSIIHSMVAYRDGSVVAQMGNPDMRTPIAYALAWPERIDAGVAPLDMFAISQLTFTPPDTARFPCLRLAQDAMDAGGTAPIVLNAVNEIAVDAFLNEQLAFTAIPRLIEHVLSRHDAHPVTSLEMVFAHDAQARQAAREALPLFQCP